MFSKTLLSFSALSGTFSLVMGQTYSARATFFSNSGPGACGDVFSAGDPVVAISSDLYGSPSVPSPNCGRQMRITYKGKSVKATVKDNSPWVTGNDIDLTTGAFTQLADLSAGTIDVQWSWV